MAQSDTRISRFLSLVLRHAPEEAGVRLDAAGWVAVDALLDGAAARGMAFSRADLERVVATSDKRRFELDGERIRAAQGHSVPVELGLESRTPPAVLFHGTHPGALDAIRREGLRPMARRQVHLSATPETATQVGARRGTPVVLTVDAAGMHADGQPFWRAANGVWLCAAVAPRYLTFPA
ncbi:RNA 2'-phosphotransferase [Patulibacter sp. S7RM1-6]